ncbi:MAG: hypothetical protein ACREQM_21735 [Candidatus Dormibacteraceae bacterium]
MTLLLLYGHASIAGWLLHLVIGSVVWHLVGLLVYRHPILAVLVGVAALLAVVLLRRRRRTSW